MKKILAISGGIDSMCLLHMLKDEEDVVVAHFNHGTRPSADADEKFVISYAKKYGLPYYIGRASLGPNVSEATAREARYKFLRNLAKEQKGIILTAHHLNDYCESVAINFLRGTGWRGVTALINSDIARPMLYWPKSRIYEYADKHQIVFREDPTNHEDDYLRNRVRPIINDFLYDNPSSGAILLTIGLRQEALRSQIEDLASEILPSGSTYPRPLFENLDSTTAEELLRAILARSGISATRPQLHDFLHAIKTYESGKKFNLPKDHLVKFNKTEFML